MAIDLNDKTANGNNLTNNSGAEITASLPFAASTIAVDLESSTPAYMTAADSASLSLTGDLSLETWVKFESTPASGDSMYILSKWDNISGNKRGYTFYLSIRIRNIP